MESVTPAGAARYLASRAFRSVTPGPVGLEAEFFVVDSAAPDRVPGPNEVRRLCSGALPGGSALTFEPGGQLELSAPPAVGVLRAIDGLHLDVARVEQCLAQGGLHLHGEGVDAWRTPSRWFRGVRYAAMATHFERFGGEGAGATMMTATAGLQLNIEAGSGAAEISRRWQLAHALGPPLAAAFANSPVLAGRPTGLASARLGVWQQLDATRTAPVPEAAPHLPPDRQWSAYALGARVMLVLDGGADGCGHAPDQPCTLAEWLADPALAGRPVTRRDLDYHLTTLFPPVRPRGFLEVRYLDQQRLDDWPVAAAVTAILHDDPLIAARAAEACRPAAGNWAEARCGLADPQLRTAAQECFALAAEGLAGAGASEALQEKVATYAARYTRRGRCPADDAYRGDDSGGPAREGCG